MAGEGVERGSAELSRSTRRDITWPMNQDTTLLNSIQLDLTQFNTLLTESGGAVYAGDVWRLEDAAMGCLRPCRRLRRALARHITSPPGQGLRR